MGASIGSGLACGEADLMQIQDSAQRTIFEVNIVVCLSLVLYVSMSHRTVFLGYLSGFVCVIF